jgi:cytochrome bd ubiquinol oxidase subunit II
MDAIAFWLPVVWAVLIATAVVMYVVLDGFDLGIGILFPFARSHADRDTMIDSIAPFWDGNETWLILGGGGLWVAFPAAYAAIMPANYLPVIIMLLALIFRGVSFEFRAVSKPHHGGWTFAFSAGSIVAAFAQGVILGNLIDSVSGAESRGDTFVSQWTVPLAQELERLTGLVPLPDWLSPFGILCGFGLVAGYALLGATWLIARTGGGLAEKSRRQARVLLVVILLFIAAVSLWTPLEHERIEERWFSTPNIYYLWILPAITVLVAIWAWRAIRHRAEVTPFVASVLLFLLCYLGLAISTFPFIAPPDLTIWEAAAVPESQIFTLIGVLIMLPIILAYTAFVYWTFLRHGKVVAGEGYH